MKYSILALDHILKKFQIIVLDKTQKEYNDMYNHNQEIEKKQNNHFKNTSIFNLKLIVPKYTSIFVYKKAELQKNINKKDISFDKIIESIKSSNYNNTEMNKRIYELSDSILNKNNITREEAYYIIKYILQK
jgi:septal ring factor EnvC (AmiA/AmiB activator)